MTKKFISFIVIVFFLINTSQVSFAGDNLGGEDPGFYTNDTFNEFGVKYVANNFQNEMSSNNKSTSSSWGYISEKYDVDLNKSWTITFSKEFDIDEIDGIVIQHEGKFIPVTIHLIGSKQIQVKPVESYEKDNKYTLKVFLNNLKRYSMDFYTVKEGETSTGEFELIQWKKEVDTYNGVIDLAEINLSEDDLNGFDILKDGKRVDIDYKVENTKLIFKNELDLKSNYSLIVFASKSKYEIKFKTSDLPEIYETGDRIIVKVPDMPEKGFNWPYYLAIPSNNYKQENENSKRYLLVDSTNAGTIKPNLKSYEQSVEETLRERTQNSVSVAEKLWTPMLMPVFPRTGTGYYSDGEYNMFYEHAFDRDIATLHKKLKDPSLRIELEDAFEDKGYDVEMFSRQDEQLVAMFDHAVDYLNKYGHKVETDKMFLSGYSATGTFTDRFTALQPEKVKAVASGGTVDDMILPLDKYDKENLIFPIGTYDYKDITGKAFDISKHNDVARLVYMGEADENNTLQYGDTYGNTERDIITKLWGVPVLPRAQSLIELYGESGGKGIFILDQNIKHSSSRDMDEYILDFFKANRNSDKQVYPIPKNTSQLQFKLYN